MAELRVEPRRRSTVWLWAALALVVVVGIAYYMFYYNTTP